MLLFAFFTSALVFEGYYFSKKTIFSRTQQYMQSMVSVTAEELDRIITQVNDISRSVISDEALQEFLLRYDNLDSDRFEYLTTGTELRNQLGTYALLRTEINSIYLRTDSGKEVCYMKRVSFDTDALLTHEADCRALNGRPFWFLAAPEYGIISCARQVNSIVSRSSLGYAVISLDEKFLSEIYMSLIANNGGRAFLVDSENIIISSDDKSRLGTQIDPILSSCSESSADVVNLEGQECIVYTSHFLCNGWRLTLVMPYLFHLEGLQAIRNVFLMSFLLVLVLGVLLLAVTLHRLIHPLKDLGQAIRQFGEGHFDTRCSVTTMDEFGYLATVFNTMAGNIVQLKDTVYTQQIQLRDAKLSALQMQINPHFLYNTLDSINWLAQLNGVQEISEIAFSLGALMRYALTNDAYVRAAQEIQNAQSYIQIQSYRYGERLKVQFELDEALLDTQIPKLILQPIVENSIVHGLEKKAGTGRITIRLFRARDGYAAFEIADNGVGMPKEKIEELWMRIKADEYAPVSRGIGMVNVGKRVCGAAGSTDAFEIRSAPGEGTVICMYFPCEST